MGPAALRQRVNTACKSARAKAFRLSGTEGEGELLSTTAYLDELRVVGVVSASS